MLRNVAAGLLRGLTRAVAVVAERHDRRGVRGLPALLDRLLGPLQGFLAHAPTIARAGATRPSNGAYPPWVESERYSVYW